LNELAARRPRISSKQAPAIIGGLLAVAWLVSLLTHHVQLQTTIFGIDTGALVAAVALSATLTYRGSGVVNFSVAAMAMYSSFIFYDLWFNGSLFFPPPIPSLQLWHVDSLSGAPLSTPPLWLLFAVTVAICGLMGAVFHFLVFRPLRKAPPLARVVASIGLYLVLFSTISVRFPNSEGYLFPTTLLPAGTWKIASYVVPANQGVLVIAVVAVAAILWTVFKFTSFGIATRAAAENERGALILGYNPDRLALANWVLSMALAGAFGILFATIQTSINPLQMTLLIVPALAAALVGRFRSFPIVVLAALAFGGSEAWIQSVQNASWAPSFFSYQGFSAVVPFVVIIVVLFFRGERLPSRGSEAVLRMPKAVVPRRPYTGMVFCLVAICLASFLLDPLWRIALDISLCAAVMCLSLTVLTGFMGQISLMQMTLGGISGLVLAKFCDAHGIPFPFGPILAAGAATVVGLIAAIPALRIRGVNLAVATLAAAVVIESFVYNIPAFASGFSQQSQINISAPSFFGLSFGPGSSYAKVFGYPSGGGIPDPWFSVFCGVVLVAILLGVLWIRRSRLGRRMLAVRSNERAAAAAGVSVPRTKLTAFAISAFIAGIGGTLFGYLFSGVDTFTMSSTDSLVLIAVAYLGGISMLEGSPISGLLFQSGIFAAFLAGIVHIDPQYAIYIAGVGLVFASINNPEGIAGTLRDAIAKLRRRRELHGPVAPPARALSTASGGQ
jgi:branched-chain amino acid transport system permease protein